MRLRAFHELKINEVGISVVEAKTDALKLKYALSDNDRAGHYVESDLAELIHLNKDEIKLEDYAVDLGKITSIGDIISPVMPSDEQEDPENIAGNEMTFVIKVPNDEEFPVIEKKIKAVCDEHDISLDIS